jgi:ABC-2 type transport system ATP-binding protein
MALISVKNLCKHYPEKKALDGISFELEAGEVLGLLGPNGAGKTTAIHVLLGLLAATSGGARVFGLDPGVKRHAISKRLNFSSAYTTLPSNLKVSENLRVFSMLYNVKNARIKIASLLDLFEIGHLENRLTGGLSSGEKARLNLAKCLLNDPELLLLDEPTASLDPDMADLTRRILKKIQHERGLGIVYTSHNMLEIEELCDRVVFVREGRVAAAGTPESLRDELKAATLEEAFIRLARRKSGSA